METNGLGRDVPVNVRERINRVSVLTSFHAALNLPLISVRNLRFYDMSWLKWALFTLVPIFGGAWFAYSHSEIVAPYFVPAKVCGPIDLKIQSVELSGASRTIQHKFPVNDIGDPNRERYINAVTAHLVGLFKKSPLFSESGRGPPLKLDVLFVQSVNGLVAESGNDRFGSSVLLTSPWVRISSNAWSPCSMQVTFFRQGRQIARDQMELKLGRRVNWKSSAEISQGEINILGKMYQDTVTKHSNSLSYEEIKELTSKIPDDLLFAFANTPRTDIGYIGWGFSAFLDDPVEYADVTNKAVDIFFANKKPLRINSIIELDGARKNYTFANKFLLPKWVMQ